MHTIIMQGTGGLSATDFQNAFLGLLNAFSALLESHYNELGQKKKSEYQHKIVTELKGKSFDYIFEHLIGYSMRFGKLLLENEGQAIKEMNLYSENICALVTYYEAFQDLGKN